MGSIYLVAAIPVALIGWALVRDFMAGLDDERVWSDDHIDDAGSNDLAA